ncbi:hypothetical protein AB0E69_19350 [Kribbella sp. NPDC026611]|uniref:hypothetical protein n=1 Tax=Kribbella sp. NPDC026611 TaxID=3154911 RepID=UPI0033C39697
MSRSKLPAAALVVVLLLSACGKKDSTDGGLPQPAGDGGGTTTSTTPSASASSTPTPSEPSAPQSSATATGRQIYIVTGNFRNNPAVQGLVSVYPLYFQALVAKDDTVLKKRFPSFFYADVFEEINDAERNGWVMHPPGSVVVVGTKGQSDGTVRVQLCRSQTSQYWDPKAKQWTVVAPHGAPEVIDVIKTGIGWLPYRLGPTNGVNCAGVRYPA